ncbi:MAG: putative ABC transport system permease protein [Candidatus Paceibacteria bacterium]|jgi:putative ABC transport system permease protein
MSFFAIIKEALQGLRANALRSSLTIFGIVVGIFAVTAMLALGEGLSNNILDRFNSFSTGDITVSGALRYDDLTWIKDQKYVSEVLGIQNISGVDIIVDDVSASPTIRTYIGDYNQVQGAEIISGELFDFQDLNYDAQEVVINEGFLEKIQEESGLDISKGRININGQSFDVVAVIEGGTGGFGRRGDGTIIIPYASALGLVTNTKVFSTLGVNLVNQEYYEIAGKNILESLNTSRSAPIDSEDYFAVNSAQDAIESAQETTAMLTLFLGIIGGITLFVGGIGTMNMMLTTVTERTKEIGLRKAIGARNRDILYQILVESVILTGVGGIFGILLAYGGSVIANNVLGDNSLISVVLSWSVVLNATLVAFIVGLVFGFYPAQNAAKLQPVDALRAD